MPRFPIRLSVPLRGAFAACLMAASCGCGAPAVDGEGAPSREVLRYREAWQDAMAAYGRGRFGRAAQAFGKMPEGDSLASVYRSAMWASARLRDGDTSGADGLIAAALGHPFVARDTGWTGYFHRLRLQVLPALPPAARREYLRASLRRPLALPDRMETLYLLLELDTALVGRGERLDYLRRLAPAVADARLEQAYRRALPLFASDTSRATERIFLDLEERLSLWDAAIRRAERLVRKPDTGTPALSLKIALWYGNKKSYEESIKRHREWFSRYGETPEALLQAARAYRAAGREDSANLWYSRLVARFPRDARAAEVLWMRAFDDEMNGRHAAALEGYRRIARDFPQHARSGEAMLRSGLLLLRRGEATAAASAFTELRDARKSGRLTGAARYWEGKARLAAGDSAAALEAWARLAREFPFGYHGHRAREELQGRGALPDSLRWERLLNRAEGDAVLAWLDSALPGAPTAPAGAWESRYLPVPVLFGFGLDTLAVLTLQARAQSAPGALRPLFEAAERCREAGFGYEAYRFGLRLAERLPLERWPSAPVAVLRLFYPPSYADLVRPAAGRSGLPPSLVLALIKQESGFDPRAVSRAGARGLMQLMPVTGTEQARREGMEDFHPDSLFIPAVNVRLGVTYLRDLLRRYDGDVVLALACYNAGPVAVERWMPRLKGRPPEEMAEDIGYAETREYVKRVGANWKTYRVLWGEEEASP